MASRTMLPAADRPTNIEGMRRVNPSVYLRPTAQQVSSKPAMISNSQDIMTFRASSCPNRVRRTSSGLAELQQSKANCAKVAVKKEVGTFHLRYRWTFQQRTNTAATQ